MGWHWFRAIALWLLTVPWGLAQAPDISLEVRYFEGLRSSSRKFEIEIKFLDPKLVSATEQTYFFHVKNSYGTQSIVTSPVVFPSNAKSAKIQVELNSPILFYSPQYLLTRGSNPNSATIARSFSSGLFDAQSQSSEKSYLFVWEDPPFRTAISKVDLVYSTASGWRGGPMAVPNFSFVNRNTKSATRMPTLSHLSDFQVLSNAKAQMSSVFNNMSADHRMLSMAGLNMAGFDDLPQSWTALTMADVLFIPVTDLVSLAAKEPQKARAIRDRVAAGGQLVVFNCGPKVNRRNEIMPALNAASDSTEPTPEKWTAWQFETVGAEKTFGIQQRLEEIDAEIRNLQSTLEHQSSLALYGSTGPYDATLSEIEKLNEERKEHVKKFFSTKESDFAGANGFSLELGKGTVVAIEQDLADFKRADWLSLTQFLDVMPSEAFSAIVGPEQNSHSVRGVGEPPKILFLFLVSAFAIFVGPMCFLVLSRFRRQNWILLVVPAVSLLSTLLLLAYGILIDGFAYRVNQVSSTHLDSRNNCAVVHAHNAIFAGRTPRPLEMDPNTVFYTGTESDSYYYTRNRPASYLKVNTSGTTYSGGENRARTKHRITTISVKETNASFKIRAVPSDSGSDTKVMAENALGMHVEFAIAKKDGSHYWAENIQPDGNVELAKSDPTTTESTLREKLKKFHQEVDKECFSDVYFPRSIVANAMAPGRTTSSFETPGQTWTQLDLLNGELSKLEDGEFWLITRRNPWVEDLNPDPTFQYRIHFIYGKW
ncbi:MAG: hypothetical protein ABL888_13875 [Pirellulaceae bacterium]